VLALLAAVVTTLTAVPAGAQTGLTNNIDASGLPRGAWRLLTATDWTRFDQVFGAGNASGTTAVGALLGSDSLGARQLGALASAEASLRALSGDPDARLSLGVLRSVANSRVVVTPLALRYGITSRLSFGVLVPVVQTRTTLVAELNEAGRAGNVGVLAPGDATAIQIQQAFASATANLEQALATCGTASPSPVCSRQAEAESLLGETRAFASGVQELYGTNGTQPFAPFSDEAIFQQIVQHQQALNDAYASFFGTGISSATLPGAQNTAGLDELQRFLRERGYGTRRDSLGTVERLSVGDVELSLGMQLIDDYRDSTSNSGAPAIRLAAQGVVRLPSGFPRLMGLPYEIGTGGRFDVEGRLATDVRFGRWLAATASAQYAYPISGRKTPFAPNPLEPVLGGGIPLEAEWKPGNLLRLSATPHIMLARYLSVDAHYAFVRRGSETYTYLRDTTAASVQLPGFGAGYTTAVTHEQRIGFGFSYSTAGQYGAARTPLPIEISWVHLETIAGSGGVVPKGMSDRVLLRIYTPY
jgi:hypothetical protein